VVLAMLIISLAVAGTLSVAVARMLAARRQVQIKQEQHLQAALLAEAAIARAAAQVTIDPNYAGETWKVSAGQLGGAARAQVKIAVDVASSSPDSRTIVTQAALGEDAGSAVKYSREAVIEIHQP
jgi:hypothetical protein